MNNNWSKILLFSLLSFALGFLVARTCCRGGNGGCGKGDAGCHGQSMCEHGGSCCSEGGGHCEKEGCDHKIGGACCKGGGHGDMHGGHGGKCCMEGEEGGREGKVHAIIHGIKESGFHGDTTVKIEDGFVHITRTGDKMEVKVEISDSMKVEEKTVEVTTH